MWPARVDYQEGDIVPPGYEMKTRSEKGLLVGGIITFAVPYGISFLIGGLITLSGSNNDQEEFGPLLIPVIGPFITMGQWDRVNEEGAFIMLANGFAQTAGAAMLVSSILMPEKYLERMAKLPGKPEVFVGAGSATLRMRF